MPLRGRHLLARPLMKKGVRWPALALMGLGVAAAGIGLASMSGPAPPLSGGDDTVVARVNRHSITRAEVFRAVEALPLGDQIGVRGQLERFVESLITEEVLFQWVLASDFAGEHDLRDRIRSEVVERVIRKHVHGRIAVTDEDIRAYYRENRDLVRGLHVRPRQIVLAERAECDAAMAAATDEETFARLARERSLDRTSAPDGGDMGWMMYVLSEDALGFELKLFEMKPGEMRIFESPQGCHLVRVVEVRDPPDPPFEQVRAFVQPQLEQQRERELVQALVERASRNLTVERLAAPTP